MVDSLYLNLFLLYGYIALGVVIGVLFKSNLKKLNVFFTEILIKIISPLQVFISLTTTDFALSFSFILQISLLALGCFSFLAGTSYLFLKKQRIENGKLGSYILMNAMPNVLFYTIPIVLAIFNEELTIVVVFFASVMLIIRGTVMTYICERLGADVKPDWKTTITNLIKFIPFDAVIAGLIVLSFKIPMPIEVFNVIKPTVNTIATGFSAILVGMIISGISWFEIKNYWTDIKIVALWRFGLSLVFFLPIVYFLSFTTYESEIRSILLIIMMGPPAILSVAFAVHFHLEEKFAAIAVATVTLIALAILPLLIYIGGLIF